MCFFHYKKQKTFCHFNAYVIDSIVCRKKTSFSSVSLSLLSDNDDDGDLLPLLTLPSFQVTHSHTPHSPSLTHSHTRRRRRR